MMHSNSTRGFYGAIGIAILFGMSISLFSLSWLGGLIHRTEQEKTTHSATPEHMDVIEEDEYAVLKSYVKMDDSLFICKGDVKLSVSEVGVVYFDCDRINSGLQRIISNPSELFVRQVLEPAKKE